MLIQFIDNNTSHNDILLNMNGIEVCCDSYYFSIDQLVLPKIETPEKVKLVLKKLLEQWKLAVSKAKSGEIIFLPFDFSDEYTGCLKCEFVEEKIIVSIGYLDLQGWEFYPSEIIKIINSKYLFTKSKDSVFVFVKSLFLKMIKENIDSI